MPALASRSVYLIERYWADSNGRRDTLEVGGCDGYSKAAVGSVWTGNAGQTFGKGPPRARLVDAAKAANMNQQHHRSAKARQTAKAAPVMAVNPPRGNPAFRAGYGRRDPSGAQGDPAKAVINVVNDLEMREQIESMKSDC